MISTFPGASAGAEADAELDAVADAWGAAESVDATEVLGIAAFDADGCADGVPAVRFTVAAADAATVDALGLLVVLAVPQPVTINATAAMAR